MVMAAENSIFCQFFNKTNTKIKLDSLHKNKHTLAMVQKPLIK